MLSNIRRAFLVAVFAAIAGAGSLAWGDHDHGHGHGDGRGFDGRGFSGGHEHEGFGHFGGHSGWDNHWGGGGVRFYSGYRNYGWPYSYYRNYYYRPYAYSYFGYPFLYGYGSYPSSYYYGYPTNYYSYPSDYYSYGNSYYYGNAAPLNEYVVSRPVVDIARVEIRLPDPQATIWVQGQEISSAGSVRQFQSPQLDPAQQYTYTVKAQWRGNGQLVEEERRVKVQANGQAVVDFTKPTEAAPATQAPALPDLPPPQPRPAVE
jgi:uncharacterized protein (TIGR03000 family)